jgi:hypothetical protein
MNIRASDSAPGPGSMRRHNKFRSIALAGEQHLRSRRTLQFSWLERELGARHTEHCIQSIARK